MRKPKIEDPTELIEDYKNGMFINDLAKKYDLSEGGIYYYLRKYNASRDRYEKREPSEPDNKLEERKAILRARRNSLTNFILEVMQNVDYSN